MTNDILRFLDALDVELAKIAGRGECLNLYHIGRSALILQHNLPLTTSDVDVVWMRESPLEDEAARLFGKGTENARALGMYLELVPQGLPPVPGGFQSRCQLYPKGWQVIRLFELDPNDLAATKLKSFRPKDRQDVQFLCDKGLLDADRLEQALKLAWMWTTDKDGDEERDSAFANLERVKKYLRGELSSL